MDVDRPQADGDGGRMAIWWAVVMVAIAVYCVARATFGDRFAAPHPADVAAWHAVMGAGMAVMIVWPSVPLLSVAGLVVFSAGTAWSLWRLFAGLGRAVYAGLTVGCVAMVAMATPMAAVALPPHDAPAMQPATSTGMSTPMSMAIPSVTGTGAVLFTLLCGALLAVAAAAMVHAVRHGSRIALIDASCESVMALVMAGMLLSMM